MEINVKIPDELAARVKARGLRIEEYFPELLAQLPEVTSVHPSPPRTESEIRAWLASMTQFSDKIPPLPETISRE
jgi:hypothetical protein